MRVRRVVVVKAMYRGRQSSWDVVISSEFGHLRVAVVLSVD